MSESPTSKRYRTNPIEIAIFLAITGVFFHSVYQLFYESPGFRPTALTPMMSNPLSEGRAPASASQSFLNLDVHCDKNTDQDTAANKIRLNGSLCGSEPGTDTAKFSKLTIANLANRFNATVFTDLTANKFSTDYIPLNKGKNPLHLEFTYRGGKIITQDIVITKN